MYFILRSVILFYKVSKNIESTLRKKKFKSDNSTGAPSLHLYSKSNQTNTNFDGMQISGG